MLSFFKKLFSRSPAPKRPAPRQSTVSAEYAAKVRVSQTVPPMTRPELTVVRPDSSWLEALPREPFVELNEQAWEARLYAGLAYWHEGAEDLTSTPDALALLEALSAPSEFMIRQLPAAARDALALCDDPSISRGLLSERLGKDPSLVQSFLRTANSAAMNSSGQPVLRVDVALERFGVTTARSIVLANCVDGLLSRPGQPYEQQAAAIWSHMIRTGQAAKVTSRCFDVNPEEAFAVSLLHDVGKLVVFDQISAMRAKLRRPVVIPLAFLNSLLQGAHEALGALAAFRWQMGARAANAIGTHHRRDPGGALNPLAETIYSAGAVDHVMHRGGALDLEQIWVTGQLSGSFANAADQLVAHYKAA